VQQEENEYQTFLSSKKRKKIVTSNEEIDTIASYWDTSNKNVGEDDLFLKKYILTKGWIGNDLDGDNEEDIEDEANEEKHEEFERSYNFRFEHPNFKQELTPFTPAPSKDSLRDTKVSKRSLKRKKRQEEKEAKKSREISEKNRLMNLKRDAILDKLNHLKKEGGLKKDINTEYFESDFDPESHDKLMDTLFGDDYYEDNDDDDTIPEFSDEEKVKSKGSLVEHLLLEKSKGVDISKLNEDLEEYYKLDYEDKIGDMPVRFKYINVEPNNYGLDVEDILHMENKELAKTIPNALLNPYREDHGRTHRTYLFKQQVRPKLNNKYQKYKQPVTGKTENELARKRSKQNQSKNRGSGTYLKKPNEKEIKHRSSEVV